MNPRQFIDQLDHPRIEDFIARAEAKTSGEIRVLIQREPVTDPVAAAQAAFTRLGMTRTAERNGVLLFVAPVSQSFAIIGDQRVHEKCGDSFWREVAATMEGHFRRGDFTSGLIAGVTLAGALLGEHFPRKTDDTNELSDKVVEE